MISPARTLAFDILCQVEQGGYAADLLHARCSGLDARDAGLAWEIVMGALRRQAQLDWRIRHCAGRPVSGFDAEVRIALRTGAYQLLHLDRAPAHAVVHDAVNLVRRARKSSAAGLVNALLRKLPRGPIPWPDRATGFSLPAWLWDSWKQQFTEPVAAGIARVFLEPPPTYIHVPPGREAEALALGSLATDVAGCYRLRHAAAAGFRIQDISSQAVVPLLDIAPGLSLLDLCAAPGNKTAQALAAGAKVVACDIHLARLSSLALPGCHRVVLDGALPLPFARKFDRILVDAPCSGTGTLARNPEIRWRVHPQDLPGLGRRQVALLRNALEWLDPAGKLVYSTCSLQKEENEDVVREALAGAHPGWTVRRSLRRTPGIEAGDGFYMAVITSR